MNTKERMLKMDGDFSPELMSCIRQFFAEDKVRPAGMDVYEDVFNTSLFFPLQRKAELRRMLQIARKLSPTTIMEIGMDKGGGFYHWVKGLTSVDSAIGCEVRGTPYADEFDRAFPDVDFLWLESSYDPASVRTTASWLAGDRIELLFIDGDKSEFVRDFDSYLPMMADDGIVFMHDITDPSPGAAYSQVIARGYEHEEIVDISDYVPGREVNNAYEGWLQHWKGSSCGVGVIYLGKRP